MSIFDCDDAKCPLQKFGRCTSPENYCPKPTSTIEGDMGISSFEDLLRMMTPDKGEKKK